MVWYEQETLTPAEPAVPYLPTAPPDPPRPARPKAPPAPEVPYLPTAEMSLKRRRLLFELNVHAAVDLAQAVAPAMRARGQGWIVNISSATSKHPEGPPFSRGHKLGATSTMYGATKAALERVTTGLAAELHGDGIAVNSLAPVAAVRTPGAEAIVGDVMDANPGIVEELDFFVDAVLVLCTCDPATFTGRILSSREVLTA